MENWGALTNRADVIRDEGSSFKTIMVSLNIVTAKIALD